MKRRMEKQQQCLCRSATCPLQVDLLSMTFDPETADRFVSRLSYVTCIRSRILQHPSSKQPIKAHENYFVYVLNMCIIFRSLEERYLLLTWQLKQLRLSAKTKLKEHALQVCGKLFVFLYITCFKGGKGCFWSEWNLARSNVHSNRPTQNTANDKWQERWWNNVGSCETRATVFSCWILRL